MQSWLVKLKDLKLKEQLSLAVGRELIIRCDNLQSNYTNNLI